MSSERSRALVCASILDSIQKPTTMIPVPAIGNGR
jgi:hypothetical protein